MEKQHLRHHNNVRDWLLRGTPFAVVIFDIERISLITMMLQVLNINILICMGIVVCYYCRIFDSKLIFWELGKLRIPL